MKKLYLSGPMRGIPEYNRPLFHEAARDLRARGFEVVSPAEMDEACKTEMDRSECLARDVLVIASLSDAVDGLAVLPGWRASEGAVLEIRVAQALEKPCFELVQVSRVSGVHHSQKSWILGGLLDKLRPLVGIAPNTMEEVRQLQAAANARAANTPPPVHVEPIFSNVPTVYALYRRPGRVIPVDGSAGYTVKDSGAREQFASGMQRDTTEGKIDYLLALDGPMFDRYAALMTAGAKKYDRRNWMKANGEEELERFRGSALRHMIQWLNGDRTEDHAASVVFNLTGAEYVRMRMNDSAFDERMRAEHGSNLKETS